MTTNLAPLSEGVGWICPSPKFMPERGGRYVLRVQGLQMIQWLMGEGAGCGGQQLASLSWNYLKFVGPESGFIFMTFPLFIFTPIQTFREKMLLSPSVFIFNEISYGPYLCYKVVWGQT